MNNKDNPVHSGTEVVTTKGKIMTKAKATKPVDKKHNSETEEERNKRIAFHQIFSDIKDHDETMAGVKGKLSGLYKHAEALGFSKEDFKFAMTLEKKDASEIVENLRRKIWIAEIFGSTVANLFSAIKTDRTPIDEKAFAEGKAAGLQRKVCKPPYDTASAQGQRWIEGHHEGSAEINTELSDVVDELIPGTGSSEDE